MIQVENNNAAANVQLIEPVWVKNDLTADITNSVVEVDFTGTGAGLSPHVPANTWTANDYFRFTVKGYYTSVNLPALASTLQIRIRFNGVNIYDIPLDTLPSNQANPVPIDVDIIARIIAPGAAADCRTRGIVFIRSVFTAIQGREVYNPLSIPIDTTIDGNFTLIGQLPANPDINNTLNFDVFMIEKITAP